MCSIADSEAGSAILATCSYSLCIYRPQVKSQPAPHPLHPTHAAKASDRLARSCTSCHAPSPRFTFAPRSSGYFPSQFLLSTVGYLPTEHVINTPVSTNSANKAGTSWCNSGKCWTKHWCNPPGELPLLPQSMWVEDTLLALVLTLAFAFACQHKTRRHSVAHIFPVCGLAELWLCPPAGCSQVEALLTTCFSFVLFLRHARGFTVKLKCIASLLV